MSKQKHIVTQQDLNNNPELVAKGIQVDDEVAVSDLCSPDGTPYRLDTTDDGPGPRPGDKNNPKLP